MNLATAMMMVLEMLLVMTTLANVLARAMLLETSATSAHQDTLDSHLANVFLFTIVELPYFP